MSFEEDFDFEEEFSFEEVFKCNYEDCNGDGGNIQRRPKAKVKSSQDIYNLINDNIKSYNNRKIQNGYDEMDHYETSSNYLSNVELHFSGMSKEIGNLRKRLKNPNMNTRSKNMFNRLVSRYNENIIDYNHKLKMFKRMEGHRTKRQLKNLDNGYGTVKQPKN
ncbi:6292_t:CDS:2 [Funneliformis caledonium]|uniref:6292_t:CDS:1 n=1 Tax=Funneliformis caledonium TaxID=1117310 RepID=A0A9N8Z8D5_9GLOM|nr:6292_t:CDS:2 [Funneliformis caledonium]